MHFPIHWNTLLHTSICSKTTEVSKIWLNVFLGVWSLDIYLRARIEIIINIMHDWLAKILKKQIAEGRGGMHGCLLICALFTEIQLIPVGNGLGLGSVCAPACTSQNFGMWRYDAEGCFFYYMYIYVVLHVHICSTGTLHICTCSRTHSGTRSSTVAIYSCRSRVPAASDPFARNS